ERPAIAAPQWVETVEVSSGSCPCENADVLQRRRMAFSRVKCSFLLRIAHTSFDALGARCRKQRPKSYSNKPPNHARLEDAQHDDRPWSGSIIPASACHASLTNWPHRRVSMKEGGMLMRLTMPAAAALVMLCTPAWGQKEFPATLAGHVTLPPETFIDAP